jgi:hypothetical protein
LFLETPGRYPAVNLKGLPTIAIHGLIGQTHLFPAWRRKLGSHRVESLNGCLSFHMALHGLKIEMCLKYSSDLLHVYPSFSLRFRN